MLKLVISTWYKTKVSVAHTTSHKPPVIVYPLDYFPVDNQIQMQLIDAFQADLAASLNAVIRRVFITFLWERIGLTRLANRIFKVISRILTSTRTSMTSTTIVTMNSGGHTKSDIKRDLTLFLSSIGSGNWAGQQPRRSETRACIGSRYMRSGSWTRPCNKI